MIVKGGSVDVTTYFAMRLSATGADATGLTISAFDMQYVRTREVPTAKVDAVALAATNTAHTDNRGIEIDATDQPGLYRFDWPDAAFAAGTEVILSIKHTSCFTEHLRVELVGYSPTDGVRLGLTALPNAAADAAGGLIISDAGGLDADDLKADVTAILVDTGTTLDGKIDALPTAAEAADAVWEEAIADHSGTAGSTAEALGAAGSAGDPWTTALPGAYGAGTAGKIIGDNINATVSSRATQTSVDDLPTNAELATALGTADDAVLVQVALVKAKTDNLPSDPADASVIAAAFAVTDGLITTVDTVADAIKAKTDNLPVDPADQSLVIDATNALATLIGDVPTNAELATSQAAADDATLAAIAALTIPSANANADALLDRAAGVETGWTIRQAMRIILSINAGKASGLETTTAIFRDMADSKDRVTATVDADGNRTAVTLDAT